MKIFQVGGSLRDEKLGLEVSDRDWVVVGSTPQEMIDLGYRPIGKDFPVFLHPISHEEYALARTERKTSPGYHGFSFHADPSVTLTEDLQRRDLTINAMARDADGQLIDPFHGQQDLDKRLLRHIGPAFGEDPVRLLRVARFMAKLAPFHFTVAPETNHLLQQMVLNGEVDALVPERVQQELDKGMNSPMPGVMFQFLQNWEVLERLFPQIPLARLPTSLEAVNAAAYCALPPLQRWVAWFSTLLSDTPQNIRTNLLSSWQNQYHWSREKSRLITLACELGSQIRQQNPATPETWLPILDQYDAWRRPDRFLQTLDLQQCLGTLYHDMLPNLKTRGQDALTRCQSIDNATIARSAVNPADIPALLNAHRLRALNNSHNPNEGHLTTQ